MYSADTLRRGLREPREALWHLYSAVSRRLLRRSDPPIPERDWDTLILLDACRYDLFRECNTLPGTLEPYYSIASNTAEYVNKTFRGDEFPDIVCVTATPKYTAPDAADCFHDVVHVWRDDWDDEHRTVLPEVMTERVFDAIERYPDKRILAHYVPPHLPFIGETGQALPHQVQFCDDVILMDSDEPEVWGAMKEGLYDRERVVRAYRENLELTLPAIEPLLREVEGKTVVTSDHGNAYGTLRELGLVGHPSNRHIAPLIEVPWLVHENGSRRTIVEGEAGATADDVDEAVVRERLADLGYAAASESHG